MNRVFASKSMLTGVMVGFETKSLINPVFGTYGSGYGSGGSGGGGGGGSVTLTNYELESMITIQQLYTSQLAGKHYANIPVDLEKYLRLLEIANNARIKYKHNESLAILFQITMDGITGAINAYGLNTLNVELEIKNTNIQGTLEEIINGINVTTALNEGNTGTFSMFQQFVLAPLFQYYIKLYGMPIIGEGFDPLKLAIVLTALENQGIDPYK